MTEDQAPIIVEQTYPVSRDRVWRAITEREQMVEWFFSEIPQFRAEEGFRTQFNIHSEGRDFLHLWTITEVIPEAKIVYDWRYQDMPGIGIVTFQLEDDGDGTRLRIINEGLESFPKEVPEFSRDSCINGWEYFIQGNLLDYLENNAGN